MVVDFSHETAVQRSPPVPKAFSSLDTCFIEVVALVEFVSETRLGTSAVNPTGIDEAMYSAAQRFFNHALDVSPRREIDFRRYYPARGEFARRYN